MANLQSSVKPTGSPMCVLNFNNNVNYIYLFNNKGGAYSTLPAYKVSDVVIAVLVCLP